MTMYIETASPVPFGAVFSLNIVNFFDATVANIRTRIAAHKTAKALNALTVSQLEDIGVVSTNIDIAAYEMATRRFA